MKNNNKYQNPPKQISHGYEKNEFIKSSELLVIDDEGNQLGIISKVEALQFAKDKELDLVEVSPNAKPPVAKIMSWSKFKYQLEKKHKESKGKRVEQKEMWFKAFIEEGDLQHKLKKVKEFLIKKNPVKITIRAKGRVSSDQMNNLINRIITELGDVIEAPDSKPKSEGRNLSIIVRPSKKI